MTLKSKRFSMGSSITVEGGGIFSLRKGSLKSGNRKCSRSQSLHEAQLESPLNPSPSSNMSLSVFREKATAQENLERSDELLSNHDFIKHNKSFHKLFPEIPEGESVAHAFKCSLQKEVLYHGKLFVSENHVCFHSSVLLKDTKVTIPVSSIKDVKKHNSALSMLSIQTAEEKYSFVSLTSREKCYKLLQSVLAHAQAEGVNSHPHFSSAENEADHDQLSSYSSLEDHVDFNLSSESLDTSFLPVSSEGPSRSNSTCQNSFTDEDDRGVAGSWIWRAIERLTEIKELSVLFHIYVMLMVLLLLASGYIGLRILALQEQLNSLGALADWSPHHKE